MYTRDANELAAEEERRARAPLSTEMINISHGEPVLSPPGTLTLWRDVQTGYAITHDNPTFMSLHTRISLRVSPGIIVAYDVNGDAEIFSLVPGDYVKFVPDREGE